MMKKLFICPLAVCFVVLIFQALSISYAQAQAYLSCEEQPDEWRNVSGEWIASVGPVILDVQGDRVTGIYNEDTWSLDLEYSKDQKTLFGRWSHRNGLAGPVIFYLDERGCIRHARWGGTGSSSCDTREASACVYDWAIHGRAKE